jgi:riboflavin transporter FmnP
MPVPFARKKHTRKYYVIGLCVDALLCLVFAVLVVLSSVQLLFPELAVLWVKSDWPDTLVRSLLIEALWLIAVIVNAYRFYKDYRTYYPTLKTNKLIDLKDDEDKE